MQNRASILLASGLAGTRVVIRDALESEGFAVCGEASIATEAIQLALRWRPAVCLLDTSIPGDALGAMTWIAANVPETTVVALAASEDEQELLDAIRAGARGYVSKAMDSAGLANAVHGSLRGEPALSRAMVAPLVDELQGSEGRRGVPPGLGAVDLTRRETEILNHLRQGRSTSEIAVACAIAPVTVRSHVASLLRKFGAPDRNSLLKQFGSHRRSPHHGGTRPHAGHH